MPLCIYSIAKYYQYRNHLILKKHYSQINLFWVFISFSTMCCIQILIALWSNLIIVKDLNEIQPYFSVPVCLFSFYISVLFLWRSYMNYYGIKYANSIDADQWKQLISNEKSTNNWFIINKHKYGNYKYWQKYVLISFIVFTSIIVFLRFLFLHNDRLRWSSILGILVIGTIIAVILIGIIYCKTPYYGDIFYIHHEIKYLVVDWCVGIVCATLLGIGYVMVTDEITKTILLVITAFVFLTIFFVGVTTQTLYVIQKNKKWLNLSAFSSADKKDTPLYLQHQLSLSSGSLIVITLLCNGSYNITLKTTITSGVSDRSEDLSGIQRELATMHRVDSAEKDTVSYEECSMEDVLADKDGFDSFFYHLRQEFSTEILLSLVEMTQFKEMVCDYYHSLGHNNNWNPNMFIKYPKENIPKSYIVYASMKELGEKYEFYIKGIDNEFNARKVDIIIRSYLLYERYIKLNAEFEVNISWDKRKKLTAIMGDLGEWINYDKFDQMTDVEILKFLYDVFDDCQQQMDGLLRYAFTRYQMSLLYEEFFKLWKQKKT